MEPEEFLDRITAIALFFNNLNEKEMRVLKHWIKNTIEDDLAKKAITILGADKEEVLDMALNNAFILTEMKEKAKNEGIQEGKKQGIQEGKKEGIQEGIQEGAKLEKIKTLRNLKSLGLDDKTIMKALDVNEKEYKELKELIKN